MVGDGGAGGFAVCLRVGQDLSRLTGLMELSARSASRGAESQTRRTGVV